MYSKQSENKLKYITLSIRKHDFFNAMSGRKRSIFTSDHICSEWYFDAYPHIMTEGFDIERINHFSEGNYKSSYVCMSLEA